MWKCNPSDGSEPCGAPCEWEADNRSNQIGGKSGEASSPPDSLTQEPFRAIRLFEQRCHFPFSPVTSSVYPLISFFCRCFPISLFPAWLCAFCGGPPAHFGPALSGGRPEEVKSPPPPAAFCLQCIPIEPCDVPSDETVSSSCMVRVGLHGHVRISMDFVVAMGTLPR